MTDCSKIVAQESGFPALGNPEFLSFHNPCTGYPGGFELGWSRFLGLSLKGVRYTTKPNQHLWFNPRP